MTPLPSRRAEAGSTRPGLTLVEVMIVALLIGLFAAMAIPSYWGSMEQARADLAAANLRTLWSAERLHFLEYRTITSDPNDLVALGVLQSGEVQVLGPTLTFTMYDDPSYVYQIDVDSNGVFDAVAVRSAGASFSGTLSIDEAGVISGFLVDAQGRVVRPGFR
ncbi:type IV pilin protein [Tautonia sociabilis]|uniref:Prepilin-type N-terminal cleavage/methylation domain-containing protein n=1 Tax=Tautonia sociabilis TaxID=2080755 RepID=A0A432MES3_9BACT|nr:prepilin-type N-terminal cleavage/methylation domain-containing protein [Tautonia sociabilis]RUL84181.1 prepilin-type N-terminal cleavage/methylation domain-containing protein [Tautonia sociabilis]